MKKIKNFIYVIALFLISSCSSSDMTKNKVPANKRVPSLNSAYKKVDVEMELNKIQAPSKKVSANFSNIYDNYQINTASQQSKNINDYVQKYNLNNKRYPDANSDINMAQSDNKSDLWQDDVFVDDNIVSVKNKHLSAKKKESSLDIQGGNEVNPIKVSNKVIYNYSSPVSWLEKEAAFEKKEKEEMIEDQKVLNNELKKEFNHKKKHKAKKKKKHIVKKSSNQEVKKVTKAPIKAEKPSNKVVVKSAPVAKPAVVAPVPAAMPVAVVAPVPAAMPVAPVVAAPVPVAPAPVFAAPVPVALAPVVAAPVPVAPAIVIPDPVDTSPSDDNKVNPAVKKIQFKSDSEPAPLPSKENTFIKEVDKLYEEVSEKVKEEFGSKNKAPVVPKVVAPTTSFDDKKVTTPAAAPVVDDNKVNPAVKKIQFKSDISPMPLPSKENAFIKEVDKLYEEVSEKVKEEFGSKNKAPVVPKVAPATSFDDKKVTTPAAAPVLNEAPKISPPPAMPIQSGSSIKIKSSKITKIYEYFTTLKTKIYNKWHYLKYLVSKYRNTIGWFDSFNIIDNFIKPYE